MKTYLGSYRKLFFSILFFAFAVLVATWGVSEGASQNSKKNKENSNQNGNGNAKGNGNGNGNGNGHGNANGNGNGRPKPVVSRDPVIVNGEAMITEGREIFRFDTYGDEAFWGDTLLLHQAIEGAQFGGVGSGLAPSNALALGLKVDVEALPAKLVSQLKKGKVN